ALDGFDNVAAAYTGTAHFTSSDGRAALPADTVFAPDDAGVKSFTVAFGTAGPQTVAAADGAIAGSSAMVMVHAGSAAQISFSAMAATATAGQTLATTAAVQDAQGNTVTGYAGTVHFTSSDAQAV